MAFLETGKMPIPPSQKPLPLKSSPSRPGLSRKDNPPTPPRKTPPRAKETLKKNHSIAIPEFNPLTSTIYPGVIIALKLNVTILLFVGIDCLLDTSSRGT